MGFAAQNNIDTYLLGRIAAESSSLSQAQVDQVSNYFLSLFRNDGGLRNYFKELFPAGSFAKGTAIKGSSDIDLFLSFDMNLPYDLGKLYDTIYNIALQKELRPKKQRVSIGISLGVVSVDLVPGKKQSMFGDDHSLHIYRENTWQKTNVKKQIAYVKAAQRANAIKAFKIWKRDKKLPFPSFLVELTVIKALQNSRAYTLEAQCQEVFAYISNNFMTASIEDPGCTSNIVSNDLNQSEKRQIVQAVSQIKTWSDFI
jgi:hypothetical protein